MPHYPADTRKARYAERTTPMTPFDWLILAVMAVAALLIVIDGIRDLSGHKAEEPLEPWIQVWPPDDR